MSDDEELEVLACELAEYLEEVDRAVEALCTPEYVAARLAEVKAWVREGRRSSARPGTPTLRGNGGAPWSGDSHSM